MIRESKNSILKKVVDQEVKCSNLGLKIKWIVEESSTASEDLRIEDLSRVWITMMGT